MTATVTPADADARPTGPRFSIITLAEHLRVPASVVDALLLSSDSGDVDDESPDLHSARAQYSYRDASGETYGDCWLHDEAAERIAAQFPAADFARAVVAGQVTFGPDAHTAVVPTSLLRALAEHVLTHGGAS